MVFFINLSERPQRQRLRRLRSFLIEKKGIGWFLTRFGEATNYLVSLFSQIKRPETFRQKNRSSKSPILSNSSSVNARKESSKNHDYLFKNIFFDQKTRFTPKTTLKIVLASNYYLFHFILHHPKLLFISVYSFFCPKKTYLKTDVFTAPSGYKNTFQK